MYKCNICNKEISQEEFDNGMGECLECFPDLIQDMKDYFNSRDEDGMPY